MEARLLYGLRFLDIFFGCIQNKITFEISDGFKNAWTNDYLETMLKWSLEFPRE